MQNPDNPDDSFIPPPARPMDFLHRPPEPDDFTEAEQWVQARLRAQLIKDGLHPNAPRLTPAPGFVGRLRILPFGEPSRLLSTTARHRIFGSDKVVCAAYTDPELGGRRYRCPLCQGMLEHKFPDWLKPELHFEVWVYVIVLAKGDRTGPVPVDPETISQPYRLRLEMPANIQLYRAAKMDPHLGDWERGTEFELKVGRDGGWQLRPLGAGPLVLSATPFVRTRQMISISSYLGEPHMWAARQCREGYERPCSEPEPVASPEELQSCARILDAYQNAPPRPSPEFWETLMEGSLPPLEKTISSKQQPTKLQKYYANTLKK